MKPPILQARTCGRAARRWALAAGAACAAIALGACSTTPSTPSAAPLTPEQQEARKQVQGLTSDIEAALDNIDRERLRAAEKRARAAGGAGPAGFAATAPGVSPAVAAGGAPPKSESAGTASGHSTVSPVEASATPGSGSATLPPDLPPAEMVRAPLEPPGGAPPAMGKMATMVAPGRTGISPAAASIAPPPVMPPVEPSLEEALAVVRKNIAVHPTLATALGISLLGNGAGSDGPDLGKGLSEADQKILGDILAALEIMKTSGSGTTLSERAAPLIEAGRKWQADADLSLPRLVLASRVDSFGVFTPLDPRFEQGRRHTVIIYCEVANFASKKGEDNWYTTHLSQQETLITEDGLLVFRPNSEEIEDRSLNHRRDFYLVKKLTIPENLAAGKYTLRMAVTDRTSNKIAIMSLPIEVVSR